MKILPLRTGHHPAGYSDGSSAAIYAAAIQKFPERNATLRHGYFLVIDFYFHDIRIDCNKLIRHPDR